MRAVDTAPVAILSSGVYSGRLHALFDLLPTVVEVNSRAKSGEIIAFEPCGDVPRSMGVCQPGPHRSSEFTFDRKAKAVEHEPGAV